MNKISFQLVFFSGQLKPEEVILLGATKQEQKKDEVRLAYTDKNFTIGNFAFSSFLNNTLLQSKV